MDRKIATPKWLPVIIGISVLTGTLILWRLSLVQESLHIKRTVKSKASEIKNVIHDQMESRIQALIRMAKRWEIQGAPSKKAWESDANLYTSHYAGYQAIEWVDPNFHARWVVPEGYETNPGTEIEDEKRRMLTEARNRHETLLSGPFKRAGADNIIMATIPIFRENRFEGLIAGTFKTQPLFGDILKREFGNGYSIAVFNNAKEIYRYDDSRGGWDDKIIYEAEVSIYGADWHLRVRPEEKSLAGLKSHLPRMILISGLAISLLVTLLLYFARAAQHRARLIETANRELEREVQERKRAEEAVERHAAELERSNAELEQFAYVASHDLQEPLRIVAGYVQLLARRYSGKLDSTADEFIEFAVDGARRMQRLISDLLTYSRVGRAKEYTTTDCEAVLDRTLGSLKASIDESGATITHDQLPIVVADASQMEQLFMNLLSNAIKYKNEAPPSVHISAVQRLDGWLFSVRDNGIGIDPKYFDRIFVIFQRLHGKTEYPGTGIGLAICKKVVENHGGRIWIESKPEKGSNFYFTIPIMPKIHKEETANNKER